MLLQRLVAQLRDGHAYVYVPKTTTGLQRPAQAPRRGPGMFWYAVKNRVFVKNAWGGAAQAGVRPGMEVLAVDGVSVGRWMPKRLVELRSTRGFSTDHQAQFFLFHWGLAGPQGSRMKVKLRTLKRRTATVTVPRSDSSFVPRGPAVFPEGLTRIGRQRYGTLPSGYGYIHLRDVPGELPQQLDTMLGELGNVPGLILDCRANGGGGCDHDAVFGRFVPKGKTVAFRKRYRSQGPTPYGGPMVVIVDAGVRSAGETISGIFKEDGRAYMIGPTPTAGMSSQKKFIELPSKLFKLYVSVYSNKKRFNNSKGIEGVGVPPHETVTYNPKDLAEGIDTLTQRAEELLRKYPAGKVPYKPAQFGWTAP
jgi:C-terminal processing protease CtpA/Prc